jgi:hypothetical protein
MSVKVGGKMSWQNPERPDPDGRMQHPVIVFIAFPFNNPFHSLNLTTDHTDEADFHSLAEP